MPTGAASAAPAQPSAPTTATSPPEPSVPATENSTPAPTLPPEATTNDAAGAEAFVRYWFETLNESYATMDPGPVVDASTPDCEVCNSYIGEIEQMAEESHSLEGARFELTEVVAPTPDGTGAVLVSTTFTLRPGRIFDSSGKLVDEVNGERGSLSSVLVREGEAWRMFGIGA